MIPIFKLPMLLYRLRLGWLLGKCFMQITHVGRRSGKIHHKFPNYPNKSLLILILPLESRSTI